MTITQTVKIPLDRRLIIDVPREIPTGQVILTFTPIASTGALSRGAALLQKASQMTEAEKIAQINILAEQLNREAEDVLLYQDLDI